MSFFRTKKRINRNLKNKRYLDKNYCASTIENIV